MRCMKCGREISDDQAFCANCLELMAQHPVKPDVVVQLPLRKGSALKKHIPRKKTRTAEEQVLRLKRRSRWLCLVIVLLTLLSFALGAMSTYLLHQLHVQKTIGQNYSTAETIE